MQQQLLYPYVANSIHLSSRSSQSKRKLIWKTTDTQVKGNVKMDARFLFDSSLLRSLYGFPKFFSSFSTQFLFLYFFRLNISMTCCNIGWFFLATLPPPIQPGDSEPAPEELDCRGDIKTKCRGPNSFSYCEEHQCDGVVKCPEGDDEEDCPVALTSTNPPDPTTTTTRTTTTTTPAPRTTPTTKPTTTTTTTPEPPPVGNWFNFSILLVSSGFLLHIFQTGIWTCRKVLWRQGRLLQGVEWVIELAGRKKWRTSYM